MENNDPEVIFNSLRVLWPSAKRSQYCTKLDGGEEWDVAALLRDFHARLSLTQGEKPASEKRRVTKASSSPSQSSPPASEDAPLRGKNVIVGKVGPSPAAAAAADADDDADDDADADAAPKGSSLARALGISPASKSPSFRGPKGAGLASALGIRAGVAAQGPRKPVRVVARPAPRTSSSGVIPIASPRRITPLALALCRANASSRRISVLTSRAILRALPKTLRSSLSQVHFAQDTSFGANSVVCTASKVSMLNCRCPTCTGRVANFRRSAAARSSPVSAAARSSPPPAASNGRAPLNSESASEAPSEESSSAEEGVAAGDAKPPVRKLSVLLSAARIVQSNKVEKAAESKAAESKAAEEVSHQARELSPASEQKEPSDAAETSANLLSCRSAKPSQESCAVTADETELENTSQSSKKSASNASVSQGSNMKSSVESTVNTSEKSAHKWTRVVPPPPPGPPPPIQDTHGRPSTSPHPCVPKPVVQSATKHPGGNSVAVVATQPPPPPPPLPSLVSKLLAGEVVKSRQSELVSTFPSDSGSVGTSDPKSTARSVSKQSHCVISNEAEPRSDKHVRQESVSDVNSSAPSPCSSAHALAVSTKRASEAATDVPSTSRSQNVCDAMSGRPQSAPRRMSGTLDAPIRLDIEEVNSPDGNLVTVPRSGAKINPQTCSVPRSVLAESMTADAAKSGEAANTRSAVCVRSVSESKSSSSLSANDATNSDANVSTRAKTPGSAPRASISTAPPQPGSSPDAPVPPPPPLLSQSSRNMVKRGGAACIGVSSATSPCASRGSEPPIFPAISVGADDDDASDGPPSQPRVGRVPLPPPPPPAPASPQASAAAASVPAPAAPNAHSAPAPSPARRSRGSAASATHIPPPPVPYQAPACLPKPSVGRHPAAAGPAYIVQSVNSAPGHPPSYATVVKNRPGISSNPSVPQDAQSATPRTSHASQNKPSVPLVVHTQNVGQRAPDQPPVYPNQETPRDARVYGWYVSSNTDNQVPLENVVGTHRGFPSYREHEAPPQPCPPRNGPPAPNRCNGPSSSPFAPRLPPQPHQCVASAPSGTTRPPPPVVSNGAGTSQPPGYAPARPLQQHDASAPPASASRGSTGVAQHPRYAPPAPPLQHAHVAPAPDPQRLHAAPAPVPARPSLFQQEARLTPAPARPEHAPPPPRRWAAYSRAAYPVPSPVGPRPPNMAYAPGHYTSSRLTVRGSPPPMLAGAGCGHPPHPPSAADSGGPVRRFLNMSPTFEDREKAHQKSLSNLNAGMLVTIRPWRYLDKLHRTYLEGYYGEIVTITHRSWNHNHPNYRGSLPLFGIRFYAGPKHNLEVVVSSTVFYRPEAIGVLPEIPVEHQVYYAAMARRAAQANQPPPAHSHDSMSVPWTQVHDRLQDMLNGMRSTGVEQREGAAGDAFSLSRASDLISMHYITGGEAADERAPEGATRTPAASKYRSASGRPVIGSTSPSMVPSGSAPAVPSAVSLGSPPPPNPPPPPPAPPSEAAPGAVAASGKSSPPASGKFVEYVRRRAVEDSLHRKRVTMSPSPDSNNELVFSAQALKRYISDPFPEVQSIDSNRAASVHVEKGVNQTVNQQEIVDLTSGTPMEVSDGSSSTNLTDVSQSTASGKESNISSSRSICNFSTPKTCKSSRTSSVSTSFAKQPRSPHGSASVFGDEHFLSVFSGEHLSASVDEHVHTFGGSSSASSSMAATSDIASTSADLSNPTPADPSCPTPADTGSSTPAGGMSSSTPGAIVPLPLPKQTTPCSSRGTPLASQSLLELPSPMLPPASPIVDFPPPLLGGDGGGSGELNQTNKKRQAGDSRVRSQSAVPSVRETPHSGYVRRGTSGRVLTTTTTGSKKRSYLAVLTGSDDERRPAKSNSRQTTHHGRNQTSDEVPVTPSNLKIYRDGRFHCICGASSSTERLLRRHHEMCAQWKQFLLMHPGSMSTRAEHKIAKDGCAYTLHTRVFPSPKFHITGADGKTLPSKRLSRALPSAPLPSQRRRASATRSRDGDDAADESDATVNSSDSEMFEDDVSEGDTSVVESDCEIVSAPRKTRSMRASGVQEKQTPQAVASADERSMRAKRTIDLSGDGDVGEGASQASKRRKVDDEKKDAGSESNQKSDPKEVPEKPSSSDEKAEAVIVKPGKQEVTEAELAAELAKSKNPEKTPDADPSAERSSRENESSGSRDSRRSADRSRSRSESSGRDPEDGFLATVEAYEQDDDDEWNPEQDDVFSSRRRSKRRRKAAERAELQKRRKGARSGDSSDKENANPRGGRKSGLRRSVAAPSHFQDFVTEKIDALLGFPPGGDRRAVHLAKKSSAGRNKTPELPGNVCTFSFFGQRETENAAAISGAGARGGASSSKKTHKASAHPKSGRRVPRACVPCHKAKTSCSEVLPCKRCIRLKRQHLCVPVQHLPKGRPKRGSPGEPQPLGELRRLMQQAQMAGILPMVLPTDMEGVASALASLPKETRALLRRHGVSTAIQEAAATPQTSVGMMTSSLAVSSSSAYSTSIGTLQPSTACQTSRTRASACSNPYDLVSLQASTTCQAVPQPPALRASACPTPYDLASLSLHGLPDLPALAPLSMLQPSVPSSFSAASLAPLDLNFTASAAPPPLTSSLYPALPSPTTPSASSALDRMAIDLLSGIENSSPPNGHSGRPSSFSTERRVSLPPPASHNRTASSHRRSARGSRRPPPPPPIHAHHPMAVPWTPVHDHLQDLLDGVRTTVPPQSTGSVGQRTDSRRPRRVVQQASRSNLQAQSAGSQARPTVHKAPRSNSQAPSPASHRLQTGAREAPTNDSLAWTQTHDHLQELLNGVRSGSQAPHPPVEVRPQSVPISRDVDKSSSVQPHHHSPDFRGLAGATTAAAGGGSRRAPHSPSTFSLLERASPMRGGNESSASRAKDTAGSMPGKSASSMASTGPLAGLSLAPFLPASTASRARVTESESVSVSRETHKGRLGLRSNSLPPSLPLSSPPSAYPSSRASISGELKTSIDSPNVEEDDGRSAASLSPPSSPESVSPEREIDTDNIATSDVSGKQLVLLGSLDTQVTPLSLASEVVGSPDTRVSPTSLEKAAGGSRASLQPSSSATSDAAKQSSDKPPGSAVSPISSSIQSSARQHPQDATQSPSSRDLRIVPLSVESLPKAIQSSSLQQNCDSVLSSSSHDPRIVPLSTSSISSTSQCPSTMTGQCGSQSSSTHDPRIVPLSVSSISTQNVSVPLAHPPLDPIPPVDLPSASSLPDLSLAPSIPPSSSRDSRVVPLGLSLTIPLLTGSSPELGDSSLYGSTSSAADSPSTHQTPGRYVPPPAPLSPVSNRRYVPPPAPLSPVSFASEPASEHARCQEASQASFDVARRPVNRALSRPLARRNRGPGKGRRVRTACVSCHFAKTACSGTLPCKRCIRLKRSESCRLFKHKKLGRPKKCHDEVRERAIQLLNQLIVFPHLPPGHAPMPPPASSQLPPPPPTPAPPSHQSASATYFSLAGPASAGSSLSSNSLPHVMPLTPAPAPAQRAVRFEAVGRSINVSPDSSARARTLFPLPAGTTPNGSLSGGYPMSFGRAPQFTSTLRCSPGNSESANSSVITPFSLRAFDINENPRISVIGKARSSSLSGSPTSATRNICEFFASSRSPPSHLSHGSKSPSVSVRGFTGPASSIASPVPRGRANICSFISVPRSSPNSAQCSKSAISSINTNASARTAPRSAVKPTTASHPPKRGALAHSKGSNVAGGVENVGTAIRHSSTASSSTMASPESAGVSGTVGIVSSGAAAPGAPPTECVSAAPGAPPMMRSSSVHSAPGAERTGSSIGCSKKPRESSTSSEVAPVGNTPKHSNPPAPPLNKSAGVANLTTTDAASSLISARKRPREASGSSVVSEATTPDTGPQGMDLDESSKTSNSVSSLPCKAKNDMASSIANIGASSIDLPVTAQKGSSECHTVSDSVPDAVVAREASPKCLRDLQAALNSAGGERVFNNEGKAEGGPVDMTAPNQPAQRSSERTAASSRKACGSHPKSTVRPVRRIVIDICNDDDDNEDGDKEAGEVSNGKEAGEVSDGKDADEMPDGKVDSSLSSRSRRSIPTRLPMRTPTVVEMSDALAARPSLDLKAAAVGSCRPQDVCRPCRQAKLDRLCTNDQPCLPCLSRVRGGNVCVRD